MLPNINPNSASVAPVFSLNEIGGRANLEDSISPVHPHVFVVCDGVGGNSAGEVASAEAVNSFYHLFSSRYLTIKSVDDFRQLIQDALEDFRQAISRFIAINPTAKSTSTTLTLMVLHEGKAYLAWCGDSRIYHIRHGEVAFRTKDHSLVQELLSKGVINETEAERHPQRNVIVRSLNVQTKAEQIDTIVLEDLREGDWLLLCTDGLMEQFKENLFPAYLNDLDTNTNYAMQIRSICEGRTKDNYSMHLVHYRSEQNTKDRRKKSRLLLWILPAVLTILLSFYVLFGGKGGKTQEAEVPAVDSMQLTMPVKKKEGQKSLFRSHEDLQKAEKSQAGRNTNLRDTTSKKTGNNLKVDSLVVKDKVPV
ncbi:protein phosphatase 2C domain-containing protein [Chitinophagaceae bacterium LB-8]|uniref:Protein phosphatase 2C domain-containing protein n=1 Tax=Paraflavisolibacter caeni TaxID=2982496 RepID=A0A9X2XXL9_9BACT|nr:protein phosphatase 2C domain-containing protein [Paraflavisolibacter caeni]MCU7551419.1 protein phosphatase 2C domain-containing protein [Paraflavisolibacter caeni]